MGTPFLFGKKMQNKIESSCMKAECAASVAGIGQKDETRNLNMIYRMYS